jgi:hypothetical protein
MTVPQNSNFWVALHLEVAAAYHSIFREQKGHCPVLAGNALFRL